MSATLARATAIFCSRKKAQKITDYRDTAPLRCMQTCRRNGTALPSLQTRFDYHTLVMFYKIHRNQAPSYLTSLLLPLSSRSGHTLENFLTVSPLYQKPQLSTVSYLEKLLCGMPYLLMFNKQAQSMLLRSFSNPILKYKPSTILLCFLFCSSFLDFFLYLNTQYYTNRKDKHKPREYNQTQKMTGKLKCTENTE